MELRRVVLLPSDPELALEPPFALLFFIRLDVFPRLWIAVLNLLERLVI